MRRVVLPHAPDHAELAAKEQAQREAARARRGGRLIVDPDAASQVDCGTFLAARTERLFRRLSSSLVTSGGLPILPLQERDWFDQDDAAGLDAFNCCRRMHAPDLP